jgi:hypothetical protein
LVKKLRQCCVIFDFKKDLPGDTKAKELKRSTLLELVDHVSQSKNAFTEAVLVDVIHMVGVPFAFAFRCFFFLLSFVPFFKRI